MRRIPVGTKLAGSQKAGGERTASQAAVPLALAWAGLIVYASLYAFGGWHPRPFALGFLVLPWPRWTDRFDLVANLLGYMPLGLLIFGACVRHGRSRRQQPADSRC